LSVPTTARPGAWATVAIAKEAEGMHPYPPLCPVAGCVPSLRVGRSVSPRTSLMGKRVKTAACPDGRSVCATDSSSLDSTQTLPLLCTNQSPRTLQRGWILPSLEMPPLGKQSARAPGVAI
ncbi:unnamed protein product, partial [Ectocarpus sp. 6 AP-2014]